MINKYFLPIVLLAFCTCKTFQHKSGGTAANAGGPGASSSPMSCRIEGEIVSETTVTGTDTTSLCAKYPCVAKVKIINVSGCGPSVSVPVNANDVMDINFAYTLRSTATIFPAMATKFPGLMPGDRFRANAFQHMQPGTSGALTVYDYEVVK